MTTKTKKKYIRPSRRKTLSPKQIEALQDPIGCRAIIPIDIKKEVQYSQLLGVDPRKSPNNWRYCQKPITPDKWCCADHRKIFYIDLPKKTLTGYLKIA
jgi:hypothetical protein